MKLDLMTIGGEEGRGESKMSVHRVCSSDHIVGTSRLSLSVALALTRYVQYIKMIILHRLSTE